MTEVIVVRPGTPLWDRLASAHLTDATWRELRLSDELARELGVDVGVVCIGATVDTYIDETEKNLAELFARSGAGGAVLLFDEADALFGRRADVASAHGRYADREASFVLSREELLHALAPPVLPRRRWGGRLSRG